MKEQEGGIGSHLFLEQLIDRKKQILRKMPNTFIGTTNYDLVQFLRLNVFGGYLRKGLGKEFQTAHSELIGKIFQELQAGAPVHSVIDHGKVNEEIGLLRNEILRRVGLRLPDEALQILLGEFLLNAASVQKILKQKNLGTNFKRDQFQSIFNAVKLIKTRSEARSLPAGRQGQSSGQARISKEGGDFGRMLSYWGLIQEAEGRKELRSLEHKVRRDVSLRKAVKKGALKEIRKKRIELAAQQNILGDLPEERLLKEHFKKKSPDVRSELRVAAEVTASILRRGRETLLDQLIPKVYAAETPAMGTKQKDQISAGYEMILKQSGKRESN